MTAVYLEMGARRVFACAAYARMLGIKLPEPTPAELQPLVIRALREDYDVPVKGWPPRYAARRIAWHALDHAWEIEDRSTLTP